MRVAKIILTLVVLFSLCQVTIAQEAKSISLMPERVESDKNNDGVIDRWEYYLNGQLERIEIDSDYDEIVDEKIYFENGNPIKGERDSDADGTVDTWLYY